MSLTPQTIFSNFRNIHKDPDLMKNFSILLIALLLMSTTCSDDDMNLEPGTYPQTWKLVQMSGSFMNSETTGADMDWQETIALQDNGDFTKTRDSDNTTQQASGKYGIADDNQGQTVLTLTYESQNNLVGSCYGNEVETFRFVGEQLHGDWQACDGPGLIFDRVE